MNSLKADMYKFYWEKRGVLPSLLTGLLVLLFSLFLNHQMKMSRHLEC